MTEIVAELSCNHEGSKAKLLELVYAAKDHGADTIKLQTYRPEDFTTPEGPVLPDGPWAGMTKWELYTQAQTPWDWHTDVVELATSLGLGWFSSPFSPEAVAFLESLNCPRYKIASAEIAYGPLLTAVEQTGKPLVVSTGMGTELEIAHIVKRFGPKQLQALLHCVSAYPTPMDQANLGRMQWLSDRFKGPVGLSDHSVSVIPPIVATAMGAVMIEKHLMLDGSQSLDRQHSLTPRQFGQMVALVRETVQAMTPSDVVDLTFKRRLVDGQWLR